MNTVALVDLEPQHAEVADEIARGLESVISRAAFILGEEVSQFERAYAEFSGVPHCVGVGNGTDALELILRALDIGPGAEVIVPANTFVATALAVARAGATPVIADSDPTYYLLDPEAVSNRVTDRTRAIMAVHLYGQMAPMEALGNVLANSDAYVLEDAAQAHGAKQNGSPAGSVGLAAGTSFYPGKNLGAYGDAGAVTTGTASVAQRVLALRNYGSTTKYYHPEQGFNSRLDTVQAVVLQAKLRRLAEWNAARRDAADLYTELLADVEGLSLPETRPGNEHVFHLYVVRVRNRDLVLRRLTERGIGAGLHYPVPLHLQGALRHLGHRKGDFPVSEQAAEEVLSLPLYPRIRPEQQELVAQELIRAVGTA